MSSVRRSNIHNWFRVTILLLVTSGSILLVSSSISTPSLAADYTKLGVKAGDSFDYSVSYYSTSPDDLESEYVSDGYDRVHVDVRGVVGKNVTLLITYSYPDGRNSSVMWSGDISKNLCDYLIFAGLRVDDLVCPEATSYFEGRLTVQKTVNMTILGTQRYVNVVEPGIAFDAQVILYFDKMTGILLESHRSSLAFGWMVERITSSSASFSPVSVWLQLGLVFAALATVAAIIIILIAIDRRLCTLKSQLRR